MPLSGATRSKIDPSPRSPPRASSVYTRAFTRVAVVTTSSTSGHESSTMNHSDSRTMVLRPSNRDKAPVRTRSSCRVRALSARAVPASCDALARTGPSGSPFLHKSGSSAHARRITASNTSRSWFTSMRTASISLMRGNIRSSIRRELFSALGFASLMAFSSSSRSLVKRSRTSRPLVATPPMSPGRNCCEKKVSAAACVRLNPVGVRCASSNTARNTREVGRIGVPSAAGAGGAVGAQLLASAT